MKKIFESGDAPRRFSVAETKARLSAVLRVSDHKPTLIHRRGHDVAVILSLQEYERLSAREPGGGIAGLLSRIEELKAKHAYGVADFAPERAVLRTKSVSLGRSR